VRRVCKLYVDPLPGATVLCIDEKTCIQALDRLRSLVFHALPDRERAMPRRATQQDADGGAFIFRALGYPHLRARAVADRVLTETGPVENPTADIRLRLVSADEWRVELKLGARWQKTPNVGPRGNMVAAICDLFGQTTHRRK
jgi:hypothetical protein